MLIDIIAGAGPNFMKLKPIIRTRRAGCCGIAWYIGARGLPVLFPVHPYTAKTLRDLKEVPANFQLVDQQPLSGIQLLGRARQGCDHRFGGITDDTTVMGVPYQTLRDRAERPVTVTIGTNRPALASGLNKLFAGQWKKGTLPENWDGQTGEGIVQVMEQLLAYKPLRAQ